MFYNKQITSLFVVIALLSSFNNNNVVNCLTIVQNTNINGVQTFNLQSSPYLIENDLIIMRNSKLIIEPGVELRFNKYKQLIVYGTLEAKGLENKRIKLTKNTQQSSTTTTTSNKWFDKNEFMNKLRLVEGDTLQDGKLQIFYNNEWRYVCSNHFNWSESDANVTCRSMGYYNGTFYYYAPANNQTLNMKMYLPRCNGNESNLFNCPGSVNPELGLTACDNTNIVNLVCEGFNSENEQIIDNWGGIVFEKYAPYMKIQQFSSVFYNISRSILSYVDVTHAGNRYNQRKKQAYPSSAIIVFQYAPLFNNLLVEYSAGTGLNYSNIEAPALIQNSEFRFNKGHGIAINTRFGNLTVHNVNSHDNFGDGLKYFFNNSVWTQQEQEEYFNIRYGDYCRSQNPLTFPTYYRFKNPLYVRECSKTFSSGDSDLRITLHFQKVLIKSEYIKYWLEVYDGQSELNTLIANFTFSNNRTPESIYSRSNFMLVKIKFYCTINFTQSQQQQQQQQQYLQNNNPYLFNNKNNYNPITNSPFNLLQQQQQQQLQRSRIFCPNSSDDDDITMYAMIANVKDPDLVVTHSLFANNSQNGLNVTNMHSFIQLNYTHIASNQHLSGLHVHNGAGQISLYQCRVEDNYYNGINITYSGGIKEFNYTLVRNNGLYGIYIDYDVNSERVNIFQNTTINASQIEHNYLAGVVLGGYCNWSNITINATRFQFNKNHGLVIKSCKSSNSTPWYTNITRLNETAIYTHLNISWNLFDDNRLTGLKIVDAQNYYGIITNNTFINHKRGAFRLHANQSRTTDTLIRNITLDIFYNNFYNNSGRYAANIELNELNQNQKINFTGNRFEFNYMYEPYKELNSRSTVSAVLIVSSSRIHVHRNYFNNPMSKVQIGTQLENSTSIINVSYNWFSTFKPLYQLHYLYMERDLCNSKWYSIRERIFDFSNRSNLAQITYWPFACNEWTNLHEASTPVQPPNMFNFQSITDFGGLYDMGETALPVNRYVVTNDIVIRPSSKLVLKSGTQLHFLNGVGMLVQGELIIDGLPASNVQFSLADQTLLNLYSQHPSLLLELKRKQQEQEYLREAYRNASRTNTSTVPFRQLNIEPTYSIRLADGNSVYDGRLEVTINGRTGTVCNRGWNLLNSAIVCQQMGYIVDPNMFLYTKWSPEERQRTSSTPILLSEIICDELDTIIFECRYTRLQDHSCTHQDDVWIKCIKPSWAGVRFALSARTSRLQFATFEYAGQYDYAATKLAPALQVDFNTHDMLNLTFKSNNYNSLEIMLNHPFRQSKLSSLNFINNNASGLFTRSSFLNIVNLYSTQQRFSAIEYNPFFEYKTLESIRVNIQPQRGPDIKRELTRLKDNIWNIGNEPIVYLYTDTEFNFGPKQLNIKIETNNDRVLVVDLIDYNPNFNEEQVLFCEKLCKNSLLDSNSREWNLSLPSNSIYFPINTSYSVLHINYNITSLKSGRLAFIVYSVKAPERVYDSRNPNGYILKNIMPDNVISIFNSTFVANRHSIVFRHYDDTEDIYGNLRKRSSNLTVNVAQSTFDTNHDDILVSELGYQINDLVPSVKLGPFGRVNVTFDNCLFTNNYGGVRSLYRYHEYSNTIWHFEIKNNRFVENKQSLVKIFLPRLYRFAVKNEWENTTHSMTVHNNEFSANKQFEFSLDGYYAQINVTQNSFVDNMCKIGLIKFSGTEKDFYVYNNRIERNEGNYMFDFDAHSLSDNDLDIESLFVENLIGENRKPIDQISTFKRIQNMGGSITRTASTLFLSNSPSSYTIALRGVQNCTFRRNLLENEKFDYEFVGGIITGTLNSTIDATYNWWGTSNSTIIKQRIFDIHEWNNHAIVNYVPYRIGKFDYNLGRQAPALSIMHNNNYVLGGLIEHDVTLTPNSVPYQIRADLTIMPGCTLYINAGVEMEFYPNVGILVLGDLRAIGDKDNYIKMRPIRKRNNRMPYYSNNDGEYTAITRVAADFTLNDQTFYDPTDTFHINSTKKLRLFEGITDNEGFLQVYNSTLRAWTMVCDRQFTLRSAQVACKQLGREYRNALVKSLSYYMAPQYQMPVWNQTFICKGGETTLSDCDTFANYHMSDCIRQGGYTYVICGKYNLPSDDYESWGGVRFAQPYFESKYTTFSVLQQPSEQRDNSILNYVDIYGAGQLHAEPNPAVQLIYRSPQISNCIIRNSTYHGFEFIQPKGSLSVNYVKTEYNLGYGFNALLLNGQTTDQKSSFLLLKKNTISNQNVFGMIDMCDPHKHYNIDQRVIIFYKYSNLAKDCVKIFRNKLTNPNSGQLGLRFLQVNLVNNTVQNDTIEIYNGTLFNQKYLIATLTNGSTDTDFQQFYMSKTDTLSVYLKASVGREYYGFIAEVLTYPTSQYLSPDSYIEISDNEVKYNQLGSINVETAGERNPTLYLSRNRFFSNGFELFNTTTPPTVEIYLQNTPYFYFGNNYIVSNYGGVTLHIHSGSGVLITRSNVFNNLFFANRNDTILMTKGETQLPYNELKIFRNIFIENNSPRTDIVHVSALISEFSRNQLLKNTGARILQTQGYENITIPRSQEITFNLLRENYAYGIINDLQDPNRFRSTMVAASSKQLYYGNYLFNKDNDFELTALVDPYAQLYGSYGYSQNLNTINATNNYWSTNIDSEIRARIRDKYDNSSLFELIYSPPAADEFALRQGKCEVGWSQRDGTCYIYIGAYATYKEAEATCRSLSARIARETVAPSKLPSFREIARMDQFNYEANSYRKMWLHTDNTLSGSCRVMDDYPTTAILYADCVKDVNAFLCEKDPVFLGPQFRFQNEIAFAIVSAGVLLLIIVILTVLWIYKSNKRKKEHLTRQDTLRRSARANRHVLNSSGIGSSMTKSTTTLHRDQSADNVSSVHQNKYVQKHETPKIYLTDDDTYNDDSSDAYGRKKIYTKNRFQNKQQNLNTTNSDYHIYDSNVDVDTDIYNSKSRNLNESPGHDSIKTQETYTDMYVKINDKQKFETQLVKPGTLPQLSPSSRHQQQQQQQQPQQTPPSILKKSNIFTSSYDQLVNEDDKSSKTNLTSQHTSAYFPPSDDLNDYMSTLNSYSKSNRNLNTSTFTPGSINKSMSSMTNVTQYPTQSKMTFMTGQEYDDNSQSQTTNTTSSSDDNLTSQTSNSYIHNSPPLERPNVPPPPRPAPITPRSARNTGEILPQSSSNNLLQQVPMTKYGMAAENEINATDSLYNRNKEYQDVSKQMQPIINFNNQNTSSLTMKKPPILSEINKSPLLMNRNTTTTGKIIIPQETFGQQTQHLSTQDISKPPPMETEI